MRVPAPPSMKMGARCYVLRRAALRVRAGNHSGFEPAVESALGGFSHPTLLSPSGAAVPRRMNARERTSYLVCKSPPQRRRKETYESNTSSLGIDIHKKSMTVCIFADQANGSQPAYYKRNFATHSAGIQELQTWLQEHQVSEVGMEATGVYWKPVWNALEGKYGLHLCNPEHIRAIPGAKTDLRDGTRIADLLAYGKLPESFIPPRWQRELRDLTRMRTQLQQEAARVANRIAKVLEDAQIKLDCVASDILGVSGRLILHAMVAGETDETVLSEMVKGQLKKKKAELRKVLQGGVQEHHRFQLKMLLKLIDEIEEHIFQLDLRIGQYLEP